MGINAFATNLRENEMTWWIYCHLGTESEKISPLSYKSYNKLLNHTQYIFFTMDLSEDLEVKCMVQRFEMIHLT